MEIPPLVFARHSKKENPPEELVQVLFGGFTVSLREFDQILTFFPE
jgi:hypothetical protein